MKTKVDFTHVKMFHVADYVTVNNLDEKFMEWKGFAIKIFSKINRNLK